MRQTVCRSKSAADRGKADLRACVLPALLELPRSHADHPSIILLAPTVCRPQMHTNDTVLQRRVLLQKLEREFECDKLFVDRSQRLSDQPLTSIYKQFVAFELTLEFLQKNTSL
jgi:hypothetical protein